VAGTEITDTVPLIALADQMTPPLPLMARPWGFSPTATVVTA
jgi:hypothetical protein